MSARQEDVGGQSLFAHPLVCFRSNSCLALAAFVLAAESFGWAILARSPRGPNSGLERQMDPPLCLPLEILR